MRYTDWLSKRRGELMGLSALLIILHHLKLRPALPLWGYIVNKNGNIGVDFFVFLSGFGCVFALERTPDIGRYYRRRMERLLPVHYVELALMFLIVGVPSLASLASSVIPLNVWTGQPGGSWYIGACLLYYILVPPLRAMISGARHPRAAFLLLLAAAALVVPCATRGNANGALAIMRLPALVCGVAAGVFAHKHQTRRDRAVDCTLLLLVYAAGLLLARRPRLLSGGIVDLMSESQAAFLEKSLRAPLLAALIAGGLELLDKTPLRFVNVPLRHMGRHSLGLYLGHELAEAFVVIQLGWSGHPRAAAMVLLAYPVAVALEYAGDRLLRLSKKLPLSAG